jgi:hypothetical protein
MPLTMSSQECCGYEYHIPIARESADSGPSASKSLKA